MLCDLGSNNLTPVNVFHDNESTIKLALNHVFHEKKFEIDLHFVREKLNVVFYK